MFILRIENKHSYDDLTDYHLTEECSLIWVVLWMGNTALCISALSVYAEAVIFKEILMLYFARHILLEIYANRMTAVSASDTSI